ncbi:hypothetical protein TD95_001260 [Thielaviopsis punctulata]|uniref:Cell surface protein Mas1 n=1 Tax=Thielaviopsis punctulata TaxID=72032 RepID=A0A0F4ZAW2_9PEZI|nr:hypothetical protein TD95_001260 [Thielaviopsis punctulata]
MKVSIFIFAASAAAHGLVTSIIGANNVTMPGLSVIDGTPRDCTTAGCGAESDTAIMKTRDIQRGKAGPLGRTKDNNAIDPAVNIAKFMGTAGNATVPKVRRRIGRRAAGGRVRRKQRGSDDDNDAQGTKSTLAAETLVADTAGKGATSGLPTVADDGTITLTYHQVNGDGAGPLSASIDPSSGGTDEDAFQTAAVTQDVPGTLGLSRNTKTDFVMTVQMPQGMTCNGTVAGVNNVCIVRIKNPIGPFGGSAAFTQTAAARKRSLEIAAGVMG